MNAPEVSCRSFEGSNKKIPMNRKEFLKVTAAASLASLLSPLEAAAKARGGREGASGLGKESGASGIRGAESAGGEGKKIKVAVIGCGSVSTQYLPHIAQSPYIEIVACCDIKPERARKAAEQYAIPRWYKHIDQMLEGSPFDLMLTLTDMQVHGELNRKALEAGRNVWSEKPLANSYAEGKALYDLATARGLRIWGAPAVVNSPQFAFMARQINQGVLGNLASAHGHYGHEGPTWSAFFYEPLGGSMPDLGVYNIATITGLLGPAKSVVAMTSIVTPERTVDDKGRIEVREEDNAMLILEHEKGVLSHIECGFNYFDPYGHLGKGQEKATVSLYGSEGNMHLVGYDWAPNGVDLSTKAHPAPQRFVPDAEGYVWQEGASDISRHMALHTEPRINVEHALHVLEIIEGARKSQATGRRIALTSKFPWPLVK